MKRAVLIALVLVLALLASAAVAENLITKAASLFLSAGEDKRPLNAEIVFMQRGKVMTANGRMLTCSRDDDLIVQIWFPSAKKLDDFVVRYTTLTTVKFENMKEVKPDPSGYGWSFRLAPRDIASYPGDETYSPALRALQVAITDRHGKKSWIQFGLHIPYGPGSLDNNTLVVLNTLPRDQIDWSTGQMTPNPNAGALEDMKEAIAALDKNVRSVATTTKAQTGAIKELQDWVGKFTSGGTSEAPELITFPMRFIGDYVKLDMTINRPDGQIEKHVMMTHNLTLSLPKGVNTVYLTVDYGRGGVVKDPLYVIADNKAAIEGVAITVFDERGTW